MYVEKGTISALKGETTATVVPSFSDAPVSTDLVIPFFLVRCLEVGMDVVYAQFPDNTGVILARMDGEWNHDLDKDVRIRGDVQTSAVASVNAHTHEVTGSTTTGPT